MIPMLAYANPARFSGLSLRLEPWLWAGALGLILWGLALALFGVPPDYQQGETIRIMYLHVPAAWMALFIYAFMAVASLVALGFRHPLADVAAKSAADLGASFTVVCLVTGSLWGRPMWGTYWEWDARMTSVLILLFLYLGYIALWRAIEDFTTAARAAAILCLVGAVNLPIIRFSVEWFTTLHQGASVIRLDGPTIHWSQLWPLFVMAGGFLCLFLALLGLRMRSEILERRVRALRLRLLAEGG